MSSNKTFFMLWLFFLSPVIWNVGCAGGESLGHPDAQNDLVSKAWDWRNADSIATCKNGETRCVQNGVQTCVIETAGQITTWSTPVPCSSGSLCIDGKCQNLTVSAEDANLDEISSDRTTPGTSQIKVQTNFPAPQNVMGYWRTVPFSALADIDFIDGSGTFSIESGQSSTSITVTAKLDKDVEITEQFSVELYSVAGAKAVQKSTVSIYDNYGWVDATDLEKQCKNKSLWCTKSSACNFSSATHTFQSGKNYCLFTVGGNSISVYIEPSLACQNQYKYVDLQGEDKNPIPCFR